MNKRHQDIIRVLLEKNNGPWIKGSVLANTLHVSSRTIRSDIDKINRLVPNLIQSHTHKGYALSMVEYQRYVREKHISVPVEQMIPQKPNERATWILRQLLLSRTEISMEDLENCLFVSSSTIELDLQQIRRLIEPYLDITLVKRHKSIVLEGSEFNKRKLYRDLLTSELQGEFLNMNKVDQLYPNVDMITLSKKLNEIFEEEQYKLRQASFPILFLHIGIMLERISNGHMITVDGLETIQETSPQWKLSKKVAHVLEESLAIHIPSFEVRGLARLLTVYRETADGEISQSYVLDGFLEKVIKELHDWLRVDFSLDKEFVRSLSVHIEGLLDRIQHNIHIPNYLLDETKQRYPLVFDMAVWVAKRLSETIGHPLDEAEIGFIALHIGASYVRLENTKKHNVLIIGNSNSKLTHVTIEKLETRFSDRIHTISSLPFFEESMVMTLNPDLIISYAPIQLGVPVPSVVISPFFNTMDEVNVFQQLNELEKRQTEIEFTMQIGKFINEKFFYRELQAQNALEVIEKMTRELEIAGIINENFLDSVLQREEMSSTSYEIQLAIPHPMVLDSHRSIISVAYLKEPIRWGNHMVKLVLLLALNEADRDFMHLFFEWLANITMDTKSIQQLLTSETRDDFIRLMVQQF